MLTDNVQASIDSGSTFSIVSADENPITGAFSARRLHTNTNKEFGPVENTLGSETTRHVKRSPIRIQDLNQEQDTGSKN